MKWQYQVHTYKQPSGVIFRGTGSVPEELQGELAKFGTEGWELIAAYPIAMGQGATNIVVMIFKRPKE